MTARFDWKASGTNRARFEALTKLLRLRYHGQVEPPSRFDELPHDAETDGDSVFDDVDSTVALTLADFNPDRLRRAFLDRLAELVANEKGGRHVAATMMAYSQDKVDVFVTKNDKFRPHDVTFLEQIEALLRLIAGGQGSRLTKTSCLGLKDGGSQHSSMLWKSLLEHYELRLQGYIVDLRQLLKQCFPPEVPDSQSQVVELPLVSHLRGLRDAVFAQYPSTTTRNEILVAQAHFIYKNFSVNDFTGLPVSARQNLRSSIGFLGRLEASFNVLVRAAERLSGLETIKISAVGLPAHNNAVAKSSEADVAKWTLAQVFKHLGRALTDDQVHTLLGSPGKKVRWTKNKLLQEFNKLKSSTWEVHAEIQLLPSYIQAMTTNDTIFQYIGCSIRTRGCHGKLYNLWGLPSFEDLTTAQKEQLGATLRDVESLVKRHILNQDAQFLGQAKESTVGESSIKTTIPGFGQPSITNRVAEYLEKQRASVTWSKGNAKEPQHQEEVTENFVIDEPSENVTSTTGHCGNSDCNRITTRRCSHCGGPWLCSIQCEEATVYFHKFSCKRRPITTADLLERDCYRDQLPEDPQVREDYGFQRCRNRNEETNLFGLYIGVIKYHEVSSEQLHQWRTEGILVKKIIEVFSKVPERSRGGYYPWFLRNRHILKGEQALTRDEDDVDKYIQERYNEARAYLDPADQTKAVEDLTPFAKQYCFLFLSILLDSKHPPPEMAHLDLWYDFGFVVCHNTHGESTLSNYYQWLLLGNKPARDHFQHLQMERRAPSDFVKCSFTEFWKAWEEGSLMDLFDQYGTSRGADCYGAGLDHHFPALREFLSYPGKSPRLSVWKLRHFLAIEDANVLTVPPVTAAAAVEYGFRPQLDTRTRLDLRDFYVKVFQRGLLPQELDKAKKKGNIHEMADQWSGGHVSERVKRVLRELPAVVRVEIDSIDSHAA